MIKPYISAENLFYAQALNIGIRISAGNFVLCLNDDVSLDEKYIEETMKAFDISPSIGMVTGKILRSDKKTLDSTGLFLSLFRTVKERGYEKKDRVPVCKAGVYFRPLRGGFFFSQAYAR